MTELGSPSVDASSLEHDSPDALRRGDRGARQSRRWLASEIPLHLGLAADFSGSQVNSIKPHHKDLETFLKTVVSPRDDVFLLCFASRLRLAQDVTADPRLITQGLDDFEQYRKGKGNFHPNRFPELGPHEIRPPSTDTA